MGSSPIGGTDVNFDFLLSYCCFNGGWRKEDALLESRSEVHMHGLV